MPQSLDRVVAQVRRVVSAVLAPSRDELAEERDRLLAGPQPEYVDMLAPSFSDALEPLCAEGRAAVAAGQEKRIRYMTHTARLEALRVGLFRLSFGNVDDERDDAGGALVKLIGDTRTAINENDVRGQRWARRIEDDRRGRPIRAFSTIPATVARGQALGDLMRHAMTVMPYLSTKDLNEAIEQGRARLREIAAMPFEAEVPLEPAVAAGPTLPRDDDSVSDLIPGRERGTLSGPVRFR